METVVVEANKLNVESKIDRKVYTVTEDALATFGSLSDILGVIPSIDIDPDGIISLRGDSNVLILIDGEPSTQFQGSKAGENLQSISAKDIERIEVLTTPPPRFKADGAAGVINIITRKHTASGPAGLVQGSLGNRKRSVLGASGTYGGKDLTASITAGYREDYRERSVNSQVVGPDPQTGMVLDSHDLMHEIIRRNNPSLALTGNYNLDASQSIGGSVSWKRRGGLRTYTQLDGSTDPSGAIVSSGGRDSSGHDPENDYDGTLRFSQKLAAPGETLDLSLHRSLSHQHEHYDYTNFDFVPAAPDFFNNLSFHEDHGISEASADYARPLAGTGTLRLGYSFEEDDFGFGNLGETVDPVSGIGTIEPALTNEFRFHQRIHSLYQSYQGSFGAWSFLGGLRTEFTSTDAHLLTNDELTPGGYNKVYPSVHVDRSLSDQSTLSLGVSSRVQRPNPSYLNPYVDTEYTPNLRAGNPHLQPQYTRSIDLGYEYEQHGASYTLTGYYRRNKDSATDVTSYPGNGLSLSTKANLPRNDSAGLEFLLAGRLLPRLNYSLSGNGFYDQIDATALGYPGLRSTFGLNGKLKLDFLPSAADSLQLSVTRTDKRLTPQGYISAINVVNLGYKHAFTHAFTLVATVSDLFNGNRYTRYTTTPRFTQVYERATVGRVVYVGLEYSFGQKKKEKQNNFEYAPPE